MKTHFQFPEGAQIVYDVHAPKDKWGITHIDKTVLDRNFDNWALIDGAFNEE